MNFKEWLQSNNRGIISKMAQEDAFPSRGGWLTYSDYIKRKKPGKWQAGLRAWLDFQKEKRVGKD